MPRYLSVEELVIEDSFQNYCLQDNAADVLFWKRYLEAHPEEARTIEEAKELVLSLRQALSELSLGTEIESASRLPLRKPAFMHLRLRNVGYWITAAAAVFFVIIGIKNLKDSDWRQSSKEQQAQVSLPVQPMQYKAANGERKVIRLPDSTTIHLNGGSTIRVDGGFGRMNRTVYLSGEALFDVRHRSEFPFIVRLQNYDVKVLGTLFNVRSYPGEKISETSLLRGKVQIFKNDGGDLTLVPNQKVIFKNLGSSLSSSHLKQKQVQVLTTQKIVPISINPRDGSIVETAWTQNRLEIVNESLSSLKSKLERWYNVQITITDKEVSEYRFTATFEKENIREVLEALQFAYPFTYELKDGKIRISK